MQSTSSLMQSLPESLWHFSLGLYARPGVADCCLHMQDKQGVNVNVLLWCAWLGARGYMLDHARLDGAMDITCAWDSRYVQPLRNLRRQMKAEFGVDDAGVEAVRTSIKQAELQAERQLQQQLERYTAHWDCVPAIMDQHKIAKKNIRIYLSALGVADQIIAQVEQVMAWNS